MKSLLILGRQPALGLAELESLHGADKLTPLGGAALLDIEPSLINFARLGGSSKLANVITTIPTTSWRTITDELEAIVENVLSDLPDGKIKLGLSTYGVKASARDVGTTALQLKKLIKAQGRSVRIVPNKYPALNSAQVLHNQLTRGAGVEIVCVRHGDHVIVARTIHEQDIEAYARRDQDRPQRDARVGMLPPKLAQIIINLARPDASATVLDPFCGTGVLLQEAHLMGLGLYGTDLEPRMIDYTRANLAWLDSSASPLLEVGDATNHHWQAFDIVACETYLGTPLSELPPRDKLSEIISTCDIIHRKFLSNIAGQLKPGARLCLAVPAWRTKNGFLHLKTLDRLEELGYNRMSFVHGTREELIYHRPDQTVARELVVLNKL